MPLLSLVLGLFSALAATAAIYTLLDRMPSAAELLLIGGIAYAGVWAALRIRRRRERNRLNEMRDSALW